MSTQLRSQANPQQFVDYTSLTELVDVRRDNLLESMNLFETFHGTSTTAEVERISDGADLITAKERGGERNYAGQESTFMETFRIPFFPLDKAIRPQDVQDFAEYGEPNTPASVDKRVQRAMNRINLSYEDLKRKAQYAALKGVTYAPDATNSQYLKEFKNVFDVADKMYTGGVMDFSVATFDPSLFIEKNLREHIVKHAGDNAGSYKLYMLCGSGVFNSVTNHPTVIAAYDAYASSQEPLRNRLGGDVVGRVFEHKGMTYIEDISGEIARDAAVMLPAGIPEMFQTHHAPADTLDHANTVAEEMYVFFKQDNRKATIETETSFVCVNTRPELVIYLEGNTLLANA